MNTLSPAAMLLVVLVIGFVISSLVYQLTIKPRRELAAFAQSRGLIILPEDANGELKKKIEENFNIPQSGEYRDIITLWFGSGEAYFYRVVPHSERTSTTGTTSGSPHHFIAVFMPTGMRERAFAAPAVPVSGKFAEKIVSYILEHAFGAKDIKILNIKDQYPDFGQKYNVFATDEKNARDIILSEDVISTLMAYPMKRAANIMFSPKGFAVDIEPLLKKRDEMDRLIVWAEDLARVLKRNL